MFGNDPYCPECACPSCAAVRAERAKWKTDENGALYREYGFGTGRMTFTKEEVRLAGIEMPEQIQPRSDYTSPIPYPFIPHP